jgi:hypothetical protein
MTQELGRGRGRTLGAPSPGEIFTDSVRRDLADLNRQYLELGLCPDAGLDPLFAWSGEVRREIESADRGVRDRMAACPFALFEIRLPDEDPVPGTERGRVEDRSNGGGHEVTRLAACVAFTHGALFAAWRMAGSAPFAARIAFGLSPAAEAELNDTCPTRIACLAAHPGAVRARWADHFLFWAALRGAAQSDSVSALQRAHCLGICLMELETGNAYAADSTLPPVPRRR